MAGVRTITIPVHIDDNGQLLCYRGQNRGHGGARDGRQGYNYGGMGNKQLKKGDVMTKHTPLVSAVESYENCSSMNMG